eukprot:11147706-Alexandrium_andersonii.AAC.1
MSRAHHHRTRPRPAPLPALQNPARQPASSWLVSSRPSSAAARRSAPTASRGAAPARPRAGRAFRAPFPPVGPSAAASKPLRRRP